MITDKDTEERLNGVISKKLSIHVANGLMLHEMFRKLDFPPENIFVMLYKEGFGVCLKDNGREFNVLVSPTAVVKDTEWTEAANWWNTTSDQDRQTIWHTLASSPVKISVLEALAMKGMYPRVKRIQDSDSN